GPFDGAARLESEGHGLALPARCPRHPGDGHPGMSDLRTFRPGGTRIVAYVVAVIMVLITVVIGLALPDDVYFTTAETVTLWIIIVIVLIVLHGIGRSYVRVDDEGV